MKSAPRNLFKWGVFMENDNVLQNTKPCPKCGKQCHENAVICVDCGWDFKSNVNIIETSQTQIGSKAKPTGSNIMLLVASVLYGFCDLIYYGFCNYFYSVWYYDGHPLCIILLDLIFIAFVFISFKNRNKGNFSQNVLSSFFFRLAIITICNIISQFI